MSILCKHCYFLFLKCFFLFLRGSRERQTACFLVCGTPASIKLLVFFVVGISANSDKLLLFFTTIFFLWRTRNWHVSNMRYWSLRIVIAHWTWILIIFHKWELIFYDSLRYITCIAPLSCGL